MRKIKLVIIGLIFLFSNTIYAQSFGDITFLKKHGINGLNSPDESYKKTEKNLYKFELHRNKIIFWKGPHRFEFAIEKITDTRFFFKGKPWSLKVVQEGKAIIWTWGNNNDTVFTHPAENNLYTLKNLKRKTIK